MGLLRERDNAFIEYTLYLSCLLSNISQLPYFVRANTTQFMSFPGWGLLFIALLLYSKRIVVNKKILQQFILAVILVIWLFLVTLISGNKYFSSSMIYNYVISMFLFVLGAWGSAYVSLKVLNNLILIYVISTIFVSLVIFVQYFGMGYNLATRYYAYGSKNSISQIISTAIIFLIIRYHPAKRIMKLAKIVAIVFELWVLMMLRSRATLLSLVFCFVAIVFLKSTNKKVRGTVLFFGVISIFVLLSISSVKDTIINNVIFAGRNASNLDELSSGRLSILSSFPDKIKGNWFTGIGATYYECFPLSAILQFGVIGGLVIITVSLLPLIHSMRNQKQSSEWFLLFLLALGYTVDGLFEGLTPFGPGVKCYILWLLYGILISKGKSVPVYKEN